MSPYFFVINELMLLELSRQKSGFLLDRVGKIYSFKQIATSLSSR